MMQKAQRRPNPDNRRGTLRQPDSRGARTWLEIGGLDSGHAQPSSPPGPPVSDLLASGRRLAKGLPTPDVPEAPNSHLPTPILRQPLAHRSKAMFRVPGRSRSLWNDPSNRCSPSHSRPGLDFLPCKRASASIPIEDHQCKPKTRQVRAQELSGPHTATRIAFGVTSNPPANRAKSKAVASGQKPANRVFDVRVRNQHQQVTSLRRVHQPNTPVANRSSMSALPCQSRRSG